MSPPVVLMDLTDDVDEKWVLLYEWIQKHDDDNTPLTAMADDFDYLLQRLVNHLLNEVL